MYFVYVIIFIGAAYIAWNSDSTQLLACGPEDSAEVLLWNIDTELNVKISQSPEDVLTCCGWNKDNNKIVVCVIILKKLPLITKKIVYFRSGEYVANFISLIQKEIY